MLKTLILGYGNPDREDDGVAWHVLQKIATYYNCPINSTDDLDLFQTQGEDHTSQIISPPPPLHVASPHLAFALQLTPEMAETVAHYQRVCFVAAHTGAYPEEISITHLTPGYQASPFTYHLTPESCLALAQSLYGHAPAGLLISVRGYHFGYRTELSPQAAVLVPTAVESIVSWITSH